SYCSLANFPRERVSAAPPRCLRLVPSVPCQRESVYRSLRSDLPTAQLIGAYCSANLFRDRNLRSDDNPCSHVAKRDLDRGSTFLRLASRDLLHDIADNLPRYFLSQTLAT